MAKSSSESSLDWIIILLLVACIVMRIRELRASSTSSENYACVASPCASNADCCPTYKCVGGKCSP